MNLIKEVKFGKRAPSDLSKTLREIADDVDAGKVVSLVAAYVEDDNYAFVMGASLNEELILSTFLKEKIVSKFYVRE